MAHLRTEGDCERDGCIFLDQKEFAGIFIPEICHYQKAIRGVQRLSNDRHDRVQPAPALDVSTRGRSFERATCRLNLNDFRGSRSSDSERDSAFRSDPKSIDFLDGIRELKIVCFLWGKPDILYLISGVQNRRGS